MYFYFLVAGFSDSTPGAFSTHCWPGALEAEEEETEEPEARTSNSMATQMTGHTVNIPRIGCNMLIRVTRKPACQEKQWSTSWVRASCFFDTQLNKASNERCYLFRSEPGGSGEFVGKTGWNGDPEPPPGSGIHRRGIMWTAPKSACGSAGPQVRSGSLQRELGFGLSLALDCRELCSANFNVERVLNRDSEMRDFARSFQGLERGLLPYQL